MEIIYSNLSFTKVTQNLENLKAISIFQKEVMSTSINLIIG